MIFVTGGTGLLGSHLLFELTKNEDQVTAIYRTKTRTQAVEQLFQYYNPENWESQFEQINWIKGDILDTPSLMEQINENDTVYHCAALVSFHKRDFNDLMHINRDGTENIVNTCLTKKVKKLCYVSSTAAIGGENSTVISEETKWKKGPETSGYAVTKYCAEREVWRGIEEGLNAVIVNPCVILGAGNWDESSLAIFNTVKKGTRYFPPGGNATVDVRDVASIMVQLANSEINAERFLCVGSNQKFKTLIDEISEQLNVRKPNKEVSRGLVTFVRRLMRFTSFFTRKKPAITKETVNSLFGNKSYSTAKIEKAIGFEFRGLIEQVRNSIEGKI